MTRYEKINQAIRSIEPKILQEDFRDLLLVVDIQDHTQELGTPHVDSARSALDWFCEKNPNHPICLASGSHRNTKKAWSAFGYTHLSKEYPQLRFLDLNEEPMPSAMFTVFLLGAHRSPSEVWSELQSRPTRHYTPRGHTWRREKMEGGITPHLTILDAQIARGEDVYFEPIPLRLNQAYAFAGFEGADQVDFGG